LEEDAERVRDALQQHGYFKAVVDDPKTNLRDVHKTLHVPFAQSGKGKVMDVTIPIEEGDRYKLKSITFKNTQAIKNTQLLRTLFPIRDGETFDNHKIGKGLDNLRKAYGELGFINFSAVPTTEIDDEKKQIALTIEAE